MSSDMKFKKQALELPYISEYVRLVKKNKYPFCQAQYKLIDYVESAFLAEDIYIDSAQAEKYLSYQKYFPYDLFPWEKFVFVLHNCTYYTKSMQLRWPVAVIYVGRGAGKNGYLAFEDFCLLTETNGIKNYNIDIFAMSEDQAKASWEDVYNVLEDNKSKMSKFFYWNKEYIQNLKTNSVFRFRTSNFKSKDGGRPGKVDFDEYHAYENSKLIDVAVGGLGKKAHPRRTIISTNGLVRGGPLDKLIERCERILNGVEDDNGTLAFLCYCESEDEVEKPDMWYKANPSLQYLPNLLHEMKIEFTDYLNDKIDNISFAVKRMNRIPLHTENEVTSWDNIIATNQSLDEYLPEIQNKNLTCTAGIDYMKTTDFLSAGLLFNVNGKDVWITHTWVNRHSEDFSRIRAPLEQWNLMGLLTFVDTPEIAPELPVYWLADKAAELGAVIVKTGIDSYRYIWLARALKEILYASDEKGYENVLLIRPSDEMRSIANITSEFVNHNLVCGDNPLFRWGVNNTCKITSKAGNITYGKIEPKSRKTDPFKAYVAAKCASIKVGESTENSMASFNNLPGVFVY